MRLLAPFRALRPPRGARPAPRRAALRRGELGRGPGPGRRESAELLPRQPARRWTSRPGTDEHSAPVHARGTAEPRPSSAATAGCSSTTRRASRSTGSRWGSHVQTGLVASASVDAYRAGAIKRHELTRPDKEDDRTRHIDALAANDEPVFLAYRARPELDALLARGAARAPDVDFTSDDGVRHSVWRLSAGGERRAGASAGRARRALHRRRSPPERRGSAGPGAPPAAAAAGPGRPTGSSRWSSPTTSCRSSPTTGW